MALTTRSSIVNSIDPVIKTIFDGEMNKRPLYMEKYFTVDTSNRSEESVAVSGAFPLMREKAEGAPSEFTKVYDQFKQRFIHVTYSLGFNVTREAMDDDLHGTIKGKPKKLVKSHTATVDTIAANIINTGFSTTYGDGAALFSASHPSQVGSQTNTGTGADLSTTSLKAGIITLQNTTDDQGKFMSLQPRILMVPPNEKWTAVEILKSDRAQDLPSGLNSERINAIVNDPEMQGQLAIFVNPYLTDTDSWYLIDTDEQTLLWFWRKAFGLRSEDDFDTDSAKYIADARYSGGVAQWRGIYGNAGAA